MLEFNHAVVHEIGLHIKRVYSGVYVRITRNNNGNIKVQSDNMEGVDTTFSSLHRDKYEVNTREK